MFYGLIQGPVMAGILAIAIEDYGALRAGAHPIQQIGGDNLAGDKSGDDTINIDQITVTGDFTL